MKKCDSPSFQKDDVSVQFAQKLCTNEKKIPCSLVHINKYLEPKPLLICRFPSFRKHFVFLKFCDCELSWGIYCYKETLVCQFNILSRKTLFPFAFPHSNTFLKLFMERMINHASCHRYKIIKTASRKLFTII